MDYISTLHLIFDHSSGFMSQDHYTALMNLGNAYLICSPEDISLIQYSMGNYKWWFTPNYSNAFFEKKTLTINRTYNQHLYIYLEISIWVESQSWQIVMKQYLMCHESDSIHRYLRLCISMKYFYAIDLVWCSTVSVQKHFFIQFSY